jgi:hypothetical protein
MFASTKTHSGSRHLPTKRFYAPSVATRASEGALKFTSRIILRWHLVILFLCYYGNVAANNACVGGTASSVPYVMTKRADRCLRTKKSGIILSTPRPSRFPDKPGKWLTDLARKRSDKKFEISDLRDYPLPFSDEEPSSHVEPSKERRTAPLE